MDITSKLVKLMKNDENNLETYIEYVEDRKYNDKRYNISFNKLLELGWKQKVFIDEGLQKTIDYY